MSSFGGAAFKVFGDRGKWDASIRVMDGEPPVYRARIRCESEAAHKILLDATAQRVTFKKAEASKAWAATIRDGGTSGTLQVPSAGGGVSYLKTYTAVLIRYEAEGDASTPGRFDGEASWAILSDVSP